MKMVKSLLLGSAAGLVAVAGAQAADLPVKAAPVQYVKICSLYGVGFYYIPGTDMCLKIGGWVRAEAAWGQNGNSVLEPIGQVNNRYTNDLWWRVRGYITADARNQTEYGTVRSYIALGLSTNESGDEQQVFNANRAFIQWAGFTFGRAQSFFDFYSGPATSYFGFFPQSDTGDGGKDVFAYTAQFGNGFSGSISAEQRRTEQIIGNDLPVGALNGAFVAGNGAGYGGWRAPDVVGNLRVDQAWGSAQIMGAWHQVNAPYYDNAPPASSIIPEGTGHPSDKSGWALGAGLKLNTPFFGQGDYFQTQVNYTQGALRYLFQNPSGNHWIQHGFDAAYGIMSDGVYGGFIGNGTATDIELTTGWGVNAAYEHFWNPRWRTSVHGGWYEVKYNDRANAMLCVAENDGHGGFGAFSVANAGCDNDWSTWWIGTRTQWNVTKDFYMGLDVAYQHLNSAQSSDGRILAPVVPTNTTVPKLVSDENNWIARFRIHRDFYP